MKILEKNVIKDEILSPEGIEEKVEKEFRFLITLTGGGKYRTYTSDGDEIKPIGIHDTMEDAKKDVGFGMVFTGGMLVDPKKTVEGMLDMLKKSKQ